MRTTILYFCVLALVACTPVANVTNNTTDTFPLTPAPVSPATPTNTEPTSTLDPKDFAAHLTFTEGDLISLETLARDPDNDRVELAFSSPFDDDGEWQTKIGDAGDYPVTVTADDGRGGVSTQRILVSVAYANRAPVIEGPDSLTAKEGDLIELDFSATDADDDEVILSYSGWMKSNSYQTDYDDAGEHTVTVSAEDGKLESEKRVTITVEDVNRAPEITFNRESYTTTELEEVRVRATARDPDGDEVTLSYGEPLNAQGEWTPQLDDAGDRTVTVTATDGEEITTADVVIHVEAANRAPEVNVPTEDGKIYVKEGELIDLRDLLVITDREDEDITVSFSGWMTSPTHEVSYAEAGEHTVTVRATDESEHTTTATVTIVVEDVNRPPVFVQPA